VRPWLARKPDPDFQAKCVDVCGVYRGAIDTKETVRTVSIDELSGIQALERIAPSLPMRPGKVERREFEYVRHGTQALIAALDVATGKVTGSVADTRTEADFVAFLEALFAAAVPSMRWRIVCDNLDIHMSEGVVRLVARQCGIDEATLGRKKRHGILRNKSQPPSLPPRSNPPHHLPLHPQARLLAQSDRNLVLHPGPQAAAARQLYFQGRSQAVHRALHRLLQPHLGQAIQMDLGRQTVDPLTHGSELPPRCTSGRRGCPSTARGRRLRNSFARGCRSRSPLARRLTRTPLEDGPGWVKA
jgi:hypothetical protein